MRLLLLLQEQLLQLLRLALLLRLRSAKCGDESRDTLVWQETGVSQRRACCCCISSCCSCCACC